MKDLVSTDCQHIITKLPRLLQTVGANVVFDHKRDDFLELIVELTSEPIHILAENCIHVRAGITGTWRTWFDVSNIMSGGGLTGRIGVVVTWVAGRRVVVNIVIVWPVVIFVVRL